MFRIDYWNENTKKDIAYVTCSFNDLNATYTGNIYDKNKKCIGDFYADNSIEIEKTFPGLFEN